MKKYFDFYKKMMENLKNTYDAIDNLKGYKDEYLSIDSGVSPYEYKSGEQYYRKVLKLNEGYCYEKDNVIGILKAGEALNISKFDSVKTMRKADFFKGLTEGEILRKIEAVDEKTFPCFDEYGNSDRMHHTYLSIYDATGEKLINTTLRISDDKMEVVKGNETVADALKAIYNIFQAEDKFIAEIVDAPIPSLCGGLDEHLKQIRGLRDFKL